MRSIRLSLLGYFLVLLAVVLGALSWYVYRETHRTYREKETNTRDLLQARYERRYQNQLEQFDEELLRRAQTLASLAQAQWGPHGTRYHPLGLLTAALAPYGHVRTLWLGEAGDPAQRFSRGGFPEIQFAEDVMVCPKKLRGTESSESIAYYFQIYSPTGVPLQRSSSMEEVVFRLDPAQTKLPLYEPAFDDTEVTPGLRVRRVTLKAPVSRHRVFISPPRSFGPGREPRGGPERREPPQPERRDPAQPGFFDRSSPQIFIQCARGVEERDGVLAGFKQELDNELEGLQSESQTALAALRTRLLLISLAVFAATVIGGVWLVHRGLSPIQRITHAVSQVSEKDFQLRLAPEQVPTELAPIVGKLKESLHSLQHAFEREKQAAADISHELRTPISALLATTQVCLKKPRSSDEYRAALQSCTEIGQQLNVLVEKLLVLARLDAGVDKVNAEAVDVPELAAQCVALVKPLAERSGLTLRLERNGSIVIKTDAEKLREVLTNLLHNAIQYNKPDGKVELIVDRHNGQVSLEVRDTGIGIPAHARGHLFERFYRVDPSRQSDTTHAGLGLAIVKGYVDLLGGKIEVESAEGQGSTFRVQLPAPAEEP